MLPEPPTEVAPVLAPTVRVPSVGPSGACGAMAANLLAGERPLADSARGPSTGTSEAT